MSVGSNATYRKKAQRFFWPQISQKTVARGQKSAGAKAQKSVKGKKLDPPTTYGDKKSKTTANSCYAAELFRRVGGVNQAVAIEVARVDSRVK